MREAGEGAKRPSLTRDLLRSSRRRDTEQAQAAKNPIRPALVGYTPLERARPARAGLRVNPDVFEETAAPGIRMGSRGSVFGMTPEGREFADAVSILSEAPFIRLESLLISAQGSSARSRFGG